MKADKNMLNRWTIGITCFVLITGCCLISPVKAQDEDDIPKPREVQLESSDGVALSAHYYPGTKEKETVPVILLHAWTDDHKTMVKMAAVLQSQFGYAVIVPDLRGHGKSTKTTNGDDLDRDRWRASELAAVIEDIEACKKFLIKENNEGNLNIDMLSVVADGEASILAANWTLRDWSYAPLGSLKQGQDVKALVLMNPSRNFKGLNGNDAYQSDLFTGRSGAAFPIIVASDRDNQRDAKNIFDRMMRGRKALEVGDKALERYRYQIEQQRRVIKSRKDGDRLVARVIGQFIEKQVYERRHDFRWAERGSK